MFDQFLEFIASKAKPESRVRVVLDHPDLHYPIGTCMIPFREFNTDNLLNKIENVEIEKM